MDDAFSYFAARRRSVAALCAERLPFVTSGLRVTFAGAKHFGDDAFTYETRSDKLLTMRGTVSPAPTRGRVVVRREGEASIVYHTHISADGRFVIPALRLRKQADNTFILTINGPPNAPRKVYFSALCLDCLAGAPPPQHAAMSHHGPRRPPAVTLARSGTLMDERAVNVVVGDDRT